MKRLLLSLLFILCASPAWAVIYYVGKGSGDSNSNSCAAAQTNTAGSRKLTIGGTTGGIACLNPGDTLRITTGTYTEDVRADTTSFQTGTTSGTSWSSPTTIEAYCPSGVCTTPDGTYGPASGANVVTLNGQLKLIGGPALTFIIFKNFKITTPLDGIYLGGTGVTDIKVDGMDVSGTSCIGPYPTNCLSTRAIAINNDRMWVTHTAVHDNVAALPGEFHGHCFYVEGSKGTIIEFSTCYNWTMGAGIHNYTDSLPTSSENIYRYNYFHDISGAAVLNWNGNNNQIIGNVVAKSGQGFANRNNVGTSILNNTFFDNVETGYIQDSGVFVAGNIFWGNDDGDAVAELGSNAISYIQNLCPDAAGSCNILNATNPFASTTPASGSYLRLSGTSSPAYNTGTLLSCPSVDMAGTIRPQNGICDIGAWEFASASVPATIALTAPTTFDRYVTTSSTLALTGTSTCSVGTPSITWTQAVAGSTINSGSASGTTSWSVSSGTATFTADRVNTFVFTNTCSSGGGSVSTTLYLGRNSTSAQVLMLPLNEGTGTTPQDLSGSANHAVFAGSGTTWVTGKYGNGLHFNGSGWLEINDSNTMDLFAFSIGMWVKLDSVGASFQTLLQKELASSDTVAFYATVAGYCGDGRAAIFVYTSVYSSACPTSVLTPSEWHYIAATFDMFTLNIYVDGALAGTNSSISGVIGLSTGKVRIANSQYSEPLAGTIDEVRVIRNAIPLNNGTGDGCSDPIESIIKWQNCAMGSPPPGSPNSLTIGADASIKIGADASIKFGAQ